MASLPGMIRRLHRWLGLACAPLLAASALSGLVTAVLMEQGGPPVVAPASLAPFAAAAEAHRPDGARLLALGLRDAPEAPVVAWYRLGGDGPRRILQVLLGPDGGIEGRRAPDDAGPLIRKFHSSLLLGETGEVLVGLAGLSLAVALLGGAILWWPLRRRGLTLRTEAGGAALLVDLHRGCGVVLGLGLLLSAASGLALAFPQATQAALGLDGPLLPRAVASRGQGGAIIPPDRAVAVAMARFPAAWLSRVQWPEDGRGSYRVTLRQLGEVRRRGFTQVWVDAHDGTVLRVFDPHRLSIAQTILLWLQPLHSGEAMGPAGRAWAVILAVALGGMAVTGPLIWLGRRRRQGLQTAFQGQP